MKDWFYNQSDPAAADRPFQALKPIVTTYGIWKGTEIGGETAHCHTRNQGGEPFPNGNNRPSKPQGLLKRPYGQAHGKLNVV